ncbi:MAG: GNAT family N-acetyltransferase [Myxococcota bacterium]|nr:GNAT family N-acetyltransferase [Deltaproteobacteria bacterium]MDQ3333638.1 GNAT family N-acetyltransferase [Myxococcota bacterium]
MYSLRLATPDDFGAVLERTRTFNAHEGIAVDDPTLAMGLRRLLAEPALGGAWLVLREGTVIGHAVVTFGYDLEYGGVDSYLTEIWIDEAVRAAGAGSAALELIANELRARDVRALHLQVRLDNPALRLYERAGFVRSPRVVMTKSL